LGAILGNTGQKVWEALILGPMEFNRLYRPTKQSSQFTRPRYYVHFAYREKVSLRLRARDGAIESGEWQWQR